MIIKIYIDDRIFNFLKKIFTRNKLAVIIVAAILAGSAIVYAAAVVQVPNKFGHGDVISSSLINQNFEALQDKVNEVITELNNISLERIPTGTILPFGGTSDKVPAGWLICDGSEYSRTGDYQNLFNVISISFGEGDGTTTFNVPDLRGVFLRGANNVVNGQGARSDDYRDIDFGTRTWPDNDSNNLEGIGSYQLDLVKIHSHSIPIYWSGGQDYPKAAATNYNTYQGTASSSTYGGSETRPKNVVVNYIIKY